MAQLTIGLGVLLIILGLVSYFATGQQSVTALIPAFFGLPILIVGLIGLWHRARMHAMHFATLLALLGFLGALERPVRKLANGEALTWSAPLISQITMAALCGIFVILAVKSFIDARRRKEKG